MAQLFLMAQDLRADGREPQAVYLSAEDERALQVGAERTFGPGGDAASRSTPEAWRTFLRTWLRSTVDLDLHFDAQQTDVR
jgi:hypothetical protein